MKVRARKKVDATFNMSSMTDIVFLLLIFFIVLSTFVSPPGVVVDLPKADGAPTPDNSVLTVSITEEGEFDLEGTKLTYEELLADLKSKSTSLNLDKAAIKLAAHTKSDVGTTVELFADIKKLGFKKVVIATKQKGKE